MAGANIKANTSVVKQNVAQTKERLSIRA